MDNNFEKRNDEFIQRKAESYFKKYKSNMELLESSPLSKVRRVTPYDIYALGEQLEAFKAYQSICEEEGSANQLGKIPQIAYDVLTVVYGSSVIPILASTQPVEEERGTVYFKNVRPADTRGNLTAGETITGVAKPKKTPQGYASNVTDGETISTTAATVVYSGTVANAPLRRETIFVSTDITDNPFGKDDGKGNILGVGLSGSIDYDTGDYEITLASDPGDGQTITLNYQTDFESADDIPKMTSFWDSKSVLSRIYALKGAVGMLQSFAMRKRFGIITEDELAKDLVGEINAEIGGDLITKIIGSAQSSVTWDKNPSQYISYWEHKQTFVDKWAEAEGNILTNAGQGVISSAICGANACATMSTLPGFEKISDGRTSGPHLYGRFNGASIVRVPDSSICPTNDVYPFYKDESPFKSAAVYTPYMPLAVTSTLPDAPNPLSNMKAVAVWAGVDVLVKEFITKISITSS